MQCPRCQRENRSGAKFCDECGTPLQHSSWRIQASRSYTDLEHSLTEALEQQTATAEIMRVISRSPTDAQPVFDAVAESAARLCVSRDAQVFVRHGEVLRQVSHHGSIPLLPTLPLIQGTANGRAVLEGRTIHVLDMQVELNAFPEGSEIARQLGLRTILIVPLMQDGVAIGTISVRRTEAQLFTERQVALLQIFADQAVIAIENVRLFTELQEKNRALTTAHTQVNESLEQQTATSEILRVIASSPTDVQPVFDAIVRSASRLCGGEYAIVTRYDGQLLHLAAQYNPRPGTADETARFFPQAPRREASLTPRAFVDARMVHVPDVDDAEDLESSTREFYRRIGLRAALAMPMIHEGRPIGVVSVSRGSQGPFSDRQIALLQTFADQAVIAIENVRLFNETKEALEQQIATSEILRVISSSPTDVQPVFDAIAVSATTLCEADTVRIIPI